MRGSPLVVQATKNVFSPADEAICPITWVQYLCLLLSLILPSFDSRKSVFNLPSKTDMSLILKGQLYSRHIRPRQLHMKILSGLALRKKELSEIKLLVLTSHSDMGHMTCFCIVIRSPLKIYRNNPLTCSSQSATYSRLELFTLYFLERPLRVVAIYLSL